MWHIQICEEACEVRSVYLLSLGLQKCTCPHCNASEAVITLSHEVRLKQSEGFPWGLERLVSLVCVLLDLIVQHQHKGTTHASDHVWPGTFEEGSWSLILKNLLPAVDCALVHDVSCGNGDRQTCAIPINACVKWVGAPSYSNVSENLWKYVDAHLLYVQTASSYDVWRCRRDMRPDQLQRWRSEQSSSWRICACSWDLAAYLYEGEVKWLACHENTHSHNVKNTSTEVEQMCAPLAVSKHPK